MRTPVTLDPDVAATIERIRTAEGRRFEDVLNDALRIGLSVLSRTSDERPYSSPTKPRNLGEPFINIAGTSAAIATAEGERHL
jgi:hypothetical protein